MKNWFSCLGGFRENILGDTGADQLAFPGSLPTFICRGHSGRGRYLGYIGSFLISVAQSQLP